MKKAFILFFVLIASTKIFSQKLGGDTLTINDTSIHYIKIGQQVFEIKINVSLTESKPNQWPLTLWSGSTVTPLSIKDGIISVQKENK